MNEELKSLEIKWKEYIANPDSISIIGLFPFDEKSYNTVKNALANAKVVFRNNDIPSDLAFLKDTRSIFSSINKSLI